MRVAGERIHRTPFVQTDSYEVVIDVELVIPRDDPSEPGYEAETIALLKEVKERAEQGDVAWLKQHGKVYKVLQDAA